MPGKARRVRKFAPEAAVLKATLEKVLDSETFARSERARELLRYLVEQEQAGKADRLKGFAIAVDVFGRDADFDPSTDADVRVQAGRLRDLLDQYFATEGAAEPLHISIPRGSYVPTYSLLSATEPAPAAPTVEAATPATSESEPVASEVIGVQTAPSPAENAALRPRNSDASVRSRRGSPTEAIARQLQMLMAAIGVVIALLGFVAYRAFDGSSTDPDTLVSTGQVGNSTADEVETLPNMYLRVTGGELEKKVGSLLRNAMSGFDTVVFVARDVPASDVARPRDFVVGVSPGPDQGSINIELENLKNGQVVTSRRLSPDELKIDQLEDQIADFITATMPVSGAVYGYLEKHSLQQGLAKCLLLNDDYYLEQNPENHKLAYECFEKLERDGVRSPLIYSETAALCLEAVTDGYDYPPDATRDKALELAQRSVQMAPTSPYAHRAYGFIYTGLGSRAEIREMDEKGL